MAHGPDLPPHDLSELLRAIGDVSLSPGAVVAPPDRPLADHDVELLDTSVSEVTAAPLPAGAFVDGIQASRSLTHREHRPVHLHYVAAGAVGPFGAVAGCLETMELAVADIDADWALDVAGTIPVYVLGTATPGEVEKHAALRLGALREAMERELVAEIVDTVDGSLLLDGSLVGRPFDTRLCGVVKTTRRRYLADESVLWGLRQGWRSPRFKIPAGGDMGVDRYSCYLRMFPAHHRPWDFALVRLETFDPDLLDPLAARCLAERQGEGARDGRWDRHLGGVRMVEDFLRGRRPELFN